MSSLGAVIGHAYAMSLYDNLVAGVLMCATLLFLGCVVVHMLKLFVSTLKFIFFAGVTIFFVLFTFHFMRDNYPNVFDDVVRRFDIEWPHIQAFIDQKFLLMKC